jgi:uncharacterized protein
MPLRPTLSPDEQPLNPGRRRFLTGAGLALGGVALYSGTHARHIHNVTRLTFPIRNLGDAFTKLHFVQLSDIHLLEYTEPWYFEQIIHEVNALNPDIVLLTGDFVSRGPASHGVSLRAAGLAAEIISQLKAPERYAILGNHDVSVGANLVIDPLEAHGTPVLIDSYRALERGGERLWICGTDDAGTRAPDLSQAVPPDPRAPVLLMCHEPDFADAVIHHPRFPHIDLMLSGHSHGGQIRIPGIGPLILPPMGRKYVEGHFTFGHMPLYVNRGIGAVGLPFRLNCPGEITSFTLTRAPEPV